MAVLPKHVGSRKIVLSRRISELALIALFLPSQILLSQSGAVVTSGAVNIEHASNVTNVNQSTDKASINWQTFNVKPAEIINFNQPSVSSVTLNRVVGNERSVIEGALNSNGQIFLLNSNGVLLTRGSSVNAGGFLAGTLNLSDEDFQAGRYVFKGNGSNASIINQGTITARDGGYVALLGNMISNRGIISATRGTVALASGDKIRLNFDNLSDGVDSLIGVTIDEGTLNALVENRNAVYADGGRIFLTAQASNELLSAQVNTDGIIRAQTIGDLKGNIELYAHGGTANVAGIIDASAPNGGDGGFIETSGDHVKIVEGTIIDTKAANGRNGEWLIDPDGFTIGSTANDGDMSASTLNTALSSGNVTIESVSGSGNDGNINVNGEVNWSANTLTLDATNNIFVNNVMTATGTAGLTANYGSGTNADETPMGLYTLLMDSDSRVNFSGTGALRLGGEVYTVINSMEQLTAARNNPAGRYALGSDVSFPSRAAWTPLGNNTASGFTGIFNGLGHGFGNISGAATSVFGTIGAGATVSNLAVGGIIAANSDSAKTSAGILADVNWGTIANVSLPSTNILYITDSENRSTNITAAGLLIGINHGLIVQSYVWGAVRGVANTTGGLVGVNEVGGRIIESWAGAGSILNDSGVITSGYVGGLVGINKGTIRRSYAYNTITLTGGTDPQLKVGGFVGSNSGAIDESYTYSLSGLYSTAPQFSGFAGENTTTGIIANAYTTRLLAYGPAGTAANWGAGFVYRNDGVIRNVYATMTSFNSDGPRYGFARENNGTLENAYWYAEVHPNATYPEPTAGVIRLSEDSVINFGSYNFGADKADIWGASKSGHPVLRNTPVYIVPATRSLFDNNCLIYGSVTTNIGSLRLDSVRGLQGGGGLYDRMDDTSTSTYNPFTVTAPMTGGYVDAGVWKASDILAGSPYTNIKGVIRVDPKPLTISGAVDNKIYDRDTVATLNNNVAKGGLVGLVGSQTLDINYTSAEFQDKNAGTGKTVDLTYTVGDGTNGGKASNYVIANTTTAKITPKPLDVTVTGNDKAYDGTTTATADGQIAGVIADDNLAFAYTTADFDSRNAGDRTVTVNGISLTGADAGNYTISGQDSATTNATITPRPVQVYGFANEGVDTSIDASGLNVTNIIEGDDVTLGGSVGIASTTAGAQPITDFSLLTVDNSNYTVVGSIGSIIVGDANLILDSVTAGSATIAVSGNRTTVTQTTDKAVLDWLRFSLGADETLVFNQPSSSSIVLNRVMTGIRSVIEGALRANGRVFILNSGGVLFTADSSVNAGGIVASTFNLNNEDFLKGNHVFTVTHGNGSVIAAGDIVIADNGFIVLAGSHDVAHTGITSGSDTALMVSTDSLMLTLNPADNTLADYAIGDLTGDTTVGGHVRIGSTTQGGGLLTAGDTVTRTNDFTFTTGIGGSWVWDQNGDITIGEGTLTGDFVNGNLNTRDFSLRSREGDITVNDTVDWVANTKLGLLAKGDIFLNRSITATGMDAELEMNYGNDYHLITPATFSGAVLDSTGKPVAQQIPSGTEFSSVTLSGANSSLKINDDNYTLIRSMEEFAAIDDETGTATGYFALAQDLDATAWSTANMGKPSVVGQLSGTLAGLGHEVENLTLTAPTSSNVGLISHILVGIGTTNLMRDIGITDVDVVGGGTIGALAGSAEDTVIKWAYSTGSINARAGIVGGLVGSTGFTDSWIENSYSGVDITAAGGEMGGLVGATRTIIITDSHSIGNLTGPKVIYYYVNRDTGERISLYNERGLQNEQPIWSNYYIGLGWASNVGGLLGRAYYANVDCSYTTGNVTSIDGDMIGGMIGGLTGTWDEPPFPSIVSNSFATGNVVGGTRVGGLIGGIGSLVISDSYQMTVDNSYATGNVTGTRENNTTLGFSGGQIGGLIGSATYTNISNSHATGNVLTIANGRSDYMGGLVGSQRGGSISDSYAIGTVIGNGGHSTGGLVGMGGGTISGSYYYDANAAFASETTPVRSETGGILDDVLRNPEGERVKNDSGAMSGGSDGRRFSASFDQYIYQYNDGESGYSARVKSITVEESACAETQESCEDDQTRSLK